MEAVHSKLSLSESLGGLLRSSELTRCEVEAFILINVAGHVVRINSHIMSIF